MSDEVGGAELTDAFVKRRAEIERELAEAQSLAGRHGAERRKLEVAYRKALAAAAAEILPGLTPEQLARAVHLSGFTRLTREDVRGAIDAERARLLARVAEIEATPAYRDRELLRTPRVGTLTRQIDELEEFRTSLVETVTRAAHPRLETLLQNGYDTDAYNVGFWRVSFYQDWKAGDQIVERFPDAKRFADVRAAVLTARESLAVYDGRLKALRDEVAAGVALEQEHDNLADRAGRLEELHLETWRNALQDHLAALDPEALGDRLAGEPDIELLLKQAYGLAKKREYLDQIVTAQIEPLKAALVEERQKNEKDLAKAMRPKNAWRTMPRASFDKRFRTRPAKLRQGYQRAAQGYQTVYVFDRWDRGRLVDDFLWWDLMSDGRLDGDFIPEVRDFHSAHPGWRPPADDLRDDDVAAAAAATVHQPDGATLLDAS